MRKLISLLLALVMVMGLATVTFAADTEYTATEATSFNITKTYTSDETFVPGETLSFTITPDSENPDSETLSIGTNNTYTVTDLTNEITVTVPSYDTAGIYNYTIKEVAGNTAGVTSYDTTSTIYVVVLVEYDNVNEKLVLGNEKVDGVHVFIKKVNDQKVDEITNVFQTNNFTVEKNVEGNMSDLYDEFEITVTLTSAKPVLTAIEVGGETVAASEWAAADNSWSYTKVLNLSENDGPVAFNNIPFGVQVAVAETETDMKGYTAAGIDLNGVNGTTCTFSIDDDAETTDEVVVQNTKTATVDTGIALDSIPFVIMMVVCAAAAVLFVIKRRSVEF